MNNDNKKIIEQFFATFIMKRVKEKNGNYYYACN